MCPRTWIWSHTYVWGFHQDHIHVIHLSIHLFFLHLDSISWRIDWMIFSITSRCIDWSFQSLPGRRSPTQKEPDNTSRHGVINSIIRAHVLFLYFFIDVCLHSFFSDNQGLYLLIVSPRHWQLTAEFPTPATINEDINNYSNDDFDNSSTTPPPPPPPPPPPTTTTTTTKTTNMMYNNCNSNDDNHNN